VEVEKDSVGHESTENVIANIDAIVHLFNVQIRGIAYVR